MSCQNWWKQRGTNNLYNSGQQVTNKSPVFFSFAVLFDHVRFYSIFAILTLIKQMLLLFCSILRFWRIYSIMLQPFIPVEGIHSGFRTTATASVITYGCPLRPTKGSLPPYHLLPSSHFIFFEMWSTCSSRLSPPTLHRDTYTWLPSRKFNFRTLFVSMEV